MHNYLITGGEGFIGSKIKKCTSGKSFDIKSGLDILDTTQLEIASQGAPGIFHCAAKISVPESIMRPEEYYRNNNDIKKSGN